MGKADSMKKSKSTPEPPNQATGGMSNISCIGLSVKRRMRSPCDFDT